MTGRKKNKKTVKNDASLSGKVVSYTQWQPEFLQTIASISASKKHLIDSIKYDVVKKVDAGRTPPNNVVPCGAVVVDASWWVLKPKMQIAITHQDHPETIVHETIHGFSHPYLYAWKLLKEWKISISDPKQAALVKEHYSTVTNLYKKAKEKGYKVINGSSVEDNVMEFIANLSNAESVKELKKLWLYDPLLWAYKNLVNSAESLEIPYKQI